MKLYSTTTSERASKSQGGNKFIETEYLIGSKDNPECVARVRLQYNKEKETVLLKLTTPKDTSLTWYEFPMPPIICNFNACKNKAVKYGVCKKHLPLEN